MTYLYLALAFIAVAGAVALALRRHTGGPSFAAVGATVLVLVVMTVVFDNLMIAAGLVDYADEHLMGLLVGRAPVEDLSYPIAGALLLPALWHLLGRNGSGRSGREPAEGDR